MSPRATILAKFQEVAESQQRDLAPLNDDLPLLESGLDSLCFAIIVTLLEDELGFDPFSESEEVHFPVTLGDFVSLYENAGG
jgi:acyl carrier protein